MTWRLSFVRPCANSRKLLSIARRSRAMREIRCPLQLFLRIYSFRTSLVDRLQDAPQEQVRSKGPIMSPFFAIFSVGRV